MATTTSSTTTPTDPAWVTALFQPTNRMRDILRDWAGSDNSYLAEDEGTELELLPDFTTEHVLAVTDMTWEQCCRVLHSKVVWMAPNVFLCTTYVPNFVALNFAAPYVISIGPESDDKNHSIRSISQAGGAKTTAATNGFRVHITQGTSPRDPAVMATCDFLVRLLATVGRVQQQHPEDNVFVLEARSKHPNSVPTPISGAALSCLLQANYSNLQKLKLSNMALNEEHIRALATVSHRAGSMDIILDKCSLEDDVECRNAFVQCLVRNRGPTQLYRCRIECPILAAALTGNSCVSRLKLGFNIAGFHKEALVRALVHNCGLVQLDLAAHAMSNEHWTIMCQSLQTHPALTDLDLRMTGPLIHGTANRARLSDEQKAHRTGLLADMVKANTVLYTIRLDHDERDNQIYVNTILPHLETNLYRPRVHAIKKAESRVRRPLLGRALQTKSVRQKPNLLWMLLSENPDIAFFISNDQENRQA
jgi:hypothetical protein